MRMALSTRLRAPNRGQVLPTYLSKRMPHISLYPVVCVAFSPLVATVNVFDHISASSRMRLAPRNRYCGGLVILLAQVWRSVAYRRPTRVVCVAFLRCEKYS